MRGKEQPKEEYTMAQLKDTEIVGTLSLDNGGGVKLRMYTKNC